MKIKNFLNFFKKEEAPSEPTETSIESLSVDDFNNWFQNTYAGYGGYTGGAKGIYLRTDKLSSGMVSDYFEFLNITGDEYKFMDLVINNWQKQRNAIEINSLL